MPIYEWKRPSRGENLDKPCIGPSWSSRRGDLHPCPPSRPTRIWTGKRRAERLGNATRPPPSNRPTPRPNQSIEFTQNRAGCSGDRTGPKWLVSQSGQKNPRPNPDTGSDTIRVTRRSLPFPNSRFQPGALNCHRETASDRFVRPGHYRNASTKKPTIAISYSPG
jgi:hypothetical protein